jgi:hypothetical protein
VWSVLGVFDYASFERIESLSALEPYPAHYQRTGLPHEETENDPNEGLNPIGTSEIALYRHDNSPKSNGWDGCETELLSGNPKDGPSGYMMVWFNLSSAAVDACGTVELVEASFEHSATAIAEHCQRESTFEFCVYETLGGPDLVLIVKLRNLGEDLEGGCRVIYNARNMKALDLLPSTARTAESKIPQCHAFASTYSFLIYSEPGTNSTDLSQKDNPTTLSFSTSIRSAPGHEKEIIESITRGDDRLGRQLVVTGDSSILLQSDNLQDFFSLISGSLPNSVSTGKHQHNNIHLSRTTIVSNDFSNLPKSFVHDSLRFSKKLSDILNEISKILISVPYKHLRRTTQYEIRKHIDILKAAFSKNENANAVRDLLPFLLQLRRCLSHPAWSRIVDQPQKRLMLQEEFETFLHHFSTSLRNRIEHRLETLESSFVNSLDFATNRLINAYSVVSWLTWERFVSSPRTAIQEGTDQDHCIAPQFGTMVRAGSFGGVDCRELFDFARIEVEQIYPNNTDAFDYVRPISEHGEINDWNTPLVLMSISGAVLFKPERALFYFLHESAELSDWLQLRYSENLRVEMNDWILDIVTAKALERLSGTDQQIERMSKKSFLIMHQHLKTIFSEAILLEESLLSRTDEAQDPTGKNGEDKTQASKAFDNIRADLKTWQRSRLFPRQSNFEELKKKASPLFFLDKIDGVLARLNSYEYTMILEYPVSQVDYKIDEYMDGVLRRSLATFGGSDTFFNSFSRWIQNFRESLVEILSDLGAWLCFRRILSLHEGDVSSAAMRRWVLKDISAGCIEEAAIDSQFPDLHVVEQFFQRFCFLSYLESEDHLDWRKQVLHGFGEIMDAYIKLTPSVKEELIENLENVLSVTCDNFAMLPSKVNPVSIHLSLGDRLKLYIQKNGFPEYFMPKAKTPEFDLLLEFNKTWVARFKSEKNTGHGKSSDNHIEEMRYFLLRKLWSKSQRFVVPRAYDQGAIPNENT